MRILKILVLGFSVIFLLPSLLSAAIWMTTEHPENWRAAKWSSSGLLPEATSDDEAAVYILSAKTGGLKGAFASHAWVVVKPKGASYTRYDKVGWGSPIRRNNYAPDAFWYSNAPVIVTQAHGERAEALIPKVERAIADYPFAMTGGYHIYPGPNSNTFVSHVLHAVPELDAVLPSDAVGRDYPSDGQLLSFGADGRDFHINYKGLIGLAAGARSGLEFQLLGLVAGIDLSAPGLKVPAFGTIHF